MGMEIELNAVIEKEKYWNKRDEVYGFICLSIYKDILFHLYGLKTPKEVWENLAKLLLETFTIIHTLFGQIGLVKPLS